MTYRVRWHERLKVWETFSDESYSVEGRYASRTRAETVAAQLNEVVAKFGPVKCNICDQPKPEGLYSCYNPDCPTFIAAADQAVAEARELGILGDDPES